MRSKRRNAVYDHDTPCGQVSWHQMHLYIITGYRHEALGLKLSPWNEFITHSYSFLMSLLALATQLDKAASIS